jgi:hypothetical protein
MVHTRARHPFQSTLLFPNHFNFRVTKEWKRKILLESGRKWHARSDLEPPNLAQQHKQAHAYSRVGTLAVFKPHLYIDSCRLQTSINIQANEQRDVFGFRKTVARWSTTSIFGRRVLVVEPAHGSEHAIYARLGHFWSPHMVTSTPSMLDRGAGRAAEAGG